MNQEKEARAVIGASEDNAAEIRAAIRRWPELHALVKGLQGAGIFPGIRAMQFTLTGTPEYVAKGLASIHPENAPQAAKEGPNAH